MKEYNEDMLFTNREEQLIKAFLELGKLSVKEMMELLKVSTRTVYRTISDLTLSLEPLGIQLIKEGKKYYLEGDLQRVFTVFLRARASL